MALAEQLGQIRRVESGATRSLREFRKALAGLKRISVKAVQLAGRDAHKRNARRYARGQYADNRGGLVRIKPYSAKHGKRKAALKLDLRRGVMRKGILKTMQSPKAFIRLQNGFTLDLEAPNLTVTGRATIGKSKRALAGKRILEGKGKDRRVVAIGVKVQKTNRRSFLVNNYLDHFTDQKAPGLGNITRSDERDIEKRRREAVDQHLATIQGAAGVLARKDAKRLSIDVRRMFA